MSEPRFVLHFLSGLFSLPCAVFFFEWLYKDLTDSQCYLLLCRAIPRMETKELVDFIIKIVYLITKNQYLSQIVGKKYSPTPGLPRPFEVKSCFSPLPIDAPR
jgi:hypothetical protein